jgi:hypothetical protein
MHDDDERLTDTELGVAVAATAGGMIAAATILVYPPLWPLGWLILLNQANKVFR